MKSEIITTCIGKCIETLTSNNGLLWTFIVVGGAYIIQDNMMRKGYNLKVHGFELSKNTHLSDSMHTPKLPSPAYS